MVLLVTATEWLSLRFTSGIENHDVVVGNAPSRLRAFIALPLEFPLTFDVFVIPGMSTNGFTMPAVFPLAVVPA